MIECGALAGLALFSCLARNPACLPIQHRHLEPYLTAIAAQESGYRPNAIRDETLGQGMFPATRQDAERIAADRLARGHTIGGGWFQITHAANWRRHGLTVANVFDPCTNMRAGAEHFAGNIMTAAIKAYNGTGPAADAYAVAVRRRMAIASVATPIAPVVVHILPDVGRGAAGRDFAYNLNR